MHKTAFYTQLLEYNGASVATGFTQWYFSIVLSISAEFIKSCFYVLVWEKGILYSNSQTSSHLSWPEEDITLTTGLGAAGSKTFGIRKATFSMGTLTLSALQNIKGKPFTTWRRTGQLNRTNVTLFYQLDTFGIWRKSTNTTMWKYTITSKSHAFAFLLK